MLDRRRWSGSNYTRSSNVEKMTDEETEGLSTVYAEGAVLGTCGGIYPRRLDDSVASWKPVVGDSERLWVKLIFLKKSPQIAALLPGRARRIAHVAAMFGHQIG